MIEAEMKARVRDPDALHQQLRRLADGQESVYRDTYYDRPDRELTAGGRELRLRTIETDGRRESLLTYKEAAVDAASGSKPEHETQVTNPAAIDVLLRGLGLEHLVSFEKHTTNYRFTSQGRDMVATVVTVPELHGTFMELETMTGPESTDAALADVRAVLLGLGITDSDLTTEQYTEAVMKSRRIDHLRD
ncbi:MAG: class IV adenylate cyclase [Streptosporangiaceae bacterium]